VPKSIRMFNIEGENTTFSLQTFYKKILYQQKSETLKLIQNRPLGFVHNH